MEKAERVLGKVETALRPTEDSRPKTITDEERFVSETWSKDEGISTPQ